MNNDTDFIYKIRAKLKTAGNDQIPVFDVILDQLIGKASKGDLGAIKLVLEWSQKVDKNDNEWRL